MGIEALLAERKGEGELMWRELRQLCYTCNFFVETVASLVTESESAGSNLKPRRPGRGLVARDKIRAS